MRAQAGLELGNEAQALQGAFGRGGVRRVGDVVLRPYRRGGWVRHVNRTLYSGVVRFHQELEVHDRLFAWGFPTVEPLGIAFRKRGLGWQGVYVTRWQEGRPWPSRWDASPETLRALIGAIRALELAGCWAPDLNATNVMIPPEGGVCLLDWDRAGFEASRGLAARYRARLLRSLEKLGAPLELGVAIQAGLT